MGFSLWGALVSAAVLAPNLLLWWFPARPPVPSVREPLPLTVLERVGQALCLVVPAITEPGTITWWWLAPLGVALAGYYTLWARYLARRRPELLYARFWILPVPMAVLPVAVFLAAAAWLSNPWIAASALVLAAGHIPLSLRVARAVEVGS